MVLFSSSAHSKIQNQKTVMVGATNYLYDGDDLVEEVDNGRVPTHSRFFANERVTGPSLGSKLFDRTTFDFRARLAPAPA